MAPAFKAGDLVAYAGYAGAVRGIQPMPYGAGDALVISLRAPAYPIVFIPLHRVAGAVKAVNVAQADLIAANPPPVTRLEKMSARGRATQRRQGEAFREKLREAGKRGAEKRWGAAA